MKSTQKVQIARPPEASLWFPTVNVHVWRGCFSGPCQVSQLELMQMVPSCPVRPQVENLGLGQLGPLESDP